MRKRLILFLSLASALFAATGCVRDGRKGGPEQLTWGQASLSVENPIAFGDTLCYQIGFRLDTLAGEGELARQLAAVLCDSVLGTPGRATVQEAMAACADSIEAEWKSELAELYDAGSEFNEILQYYYTVEGAAVANGREDVVSYQTDLDCYLGGAHGSYVVMFYNFDKASGKLLGIRDIVPPGREQEVLAAMERQLCEDWQARDLAELQEKTGITMLGDLYLTNNFLLKGDSIEFLFNQYEIAPYSSGLIDVTIPYQPNP